MYIKKREIVNEVKGYLRKKEEEENWTDFLVTL